MQPTTASTLRQDIADVLQENLLGAGQFVGEEIMPVLPVGAKSAKFAKIAFGEVKTNAVDDKRGKSGYYNEVTHEATSDNYTTAKRGLVEPVDDDDAITLGTYFDAEVSAASLCQYYLRLNREARIAAIAFSTTVMASYTTAVTTPWSTSATCTPVKDVEAAKQSLIDQLNGMVGGPARIVGIGNRQALVDLRASSDIKDRVYAGGNVQAGMISEAQIAEILGLDSVHFSRLQRAGSQIWNTDRFGIYVVSDSLQLRSVPHFGRVMLWRDSTPTDMMVETYREEARESEMVRVKHNTVEKLLTARGGHLLTNVD